MKFILLVFAIPFTLFAGEPTKEEIQQAISVLSRPDNPIAERMKALELLRDEKAHEALPAVLDFLVEDSGNGTVKTDIAALSAIFKYGPHARTDRVFSILSVILESSDEDPEVRASSAFTIASIWRDDPQPFVEELFFKVLNEKYTVFAGPQKVYDSTASGLREMRTQSAAKMLARVAADSGNGKKTQRLPALKMLAQLLEEKPEFINSEIEIARDLFMLFKKRDSLEPEMQGYLFQIIQAVGADFYLESATENLLIELASSIASNFEDHPEISVHAIRAYSRVGSAQNIILTLGSYLIKIKYRSLARPILKVLCDLGSQDALPLIIQFFDQVCSSIDTVCAPTLDALGYLYNKASQKNPLLVLAKVPQIRRIIFDKRYDIHSRGAALKALVGILKENAIPDIDEFSHTLSEDKNEQGMLERSYLFQAIQRLRESAPMFLKHKEKRRAKLY